jgi:hypothetical protein
MLKTARMRKKKATKKRANRAKAAERKLRSEKRDERANLKPDAPKKKLIRWGAG